MKETYGECPGRSVHEGLVEVAGFRAELHRDKVGREDDSESGVVQLCKEESRTESQKGFCRSARSEGVEDVRPVADSPGCRFLSLSSRMIVEIKTQSCKKDEEQDQCTKSGLRVIAGRTE